MKLKETFNLEFILIYLFIIWDRTRPTSRAGIFRSRRQPIAFDYSRFNLGERVVSLPPGALGHVLNSSIPENEI